MIYIINPPYRWLSIAYTLHAGKQAQVVKQAYKFIGLLVAKAVSAPILHKCELRIFVLYSCVLWTNQG